MTLIELYSIHPHHATARGTISLRHQGRRSISSTKRTATLRQYGVHLTERSSVGNCLR